eukprot:Gb_26203 [translate_table: standard]
MHLSVMERFILFRESMIKQNVMLRITSGSSSMSVSDANLVDIYIFENKSLFGCWGSTYSNESRSDLMMICKAVLHHEGTFLDKGSVCNFKRALHSAAKVLVMQLTVCAVFLFRCCNFLRRLCVYMLNKQLMARKGKFNRLSYIVVASTKPQGAILTLNGFVKPVKGVHSYVGFLKIMWLHGNVTPHQKQQGFITDLKSKHLSLGCAQLIIQRELVDPG